jgi:hypothetical protein
LPSPSSKSTSIEQLLTKWSSKWQQADSLKVNYERLWWLPTIADPGVQKDMNDLLTQALKELRFSLAMTSSGSWNCVHELKSSAPIGCPFTHLPGGDSPAD